MMMGINRFGDETLPKIQEKLGFNQRLVQELLEQERHQLTVSLDWKQLVRWIEATETYKNNEEYRSRRNLDPITCYAVLSRELPTTQLRDHFEQRAFALDAMQASCIYFYLYGEISQSTVAIFQKELQTIAQKLAVEPFLFALPEWSRAFWTEQEQAALLGNMIGILGLRNRDASLIRRPNAVRWREQWIVGWLYRRLLEEDKKQGGISRYLALEECNAVYALVIKSIVYQDKRYFRMARGNEEDRLLAALLLYRFGADSKAAGDYCAFALQQFLMTGKYASLNHSERNELMMQKLWGKEFALLPPVSYTSSLGYIRTVLNNAIKDGLKKERKDLILDEDRVLIDVEQLCPMEKEQKFDTVKRLMGEIGSVRNRVALVLEFDILPEAAWLEELVQVLNQSGQRKLSFERAQELCEAILASVSLDEKEGWLSQLYQVEASSVRRYARRGRNDLKALLIGEIENNNYRIILSTDLEITPRLSWRKELLSTRGEKKAGSLAEITERCTQIINTASEREKDGLFMQLLNIDEESVQRYRAEARKELKRLSNQLRE